MLLLFLVHITSLVGFASAGELSIETIFLPPSCERKSAVGDRMTMHYTGTIDATSAAGVVGKQFDSSRTKNKPFQFTLGQGRVIEGWEQGLIDMCVGEKRTLVIPPNLGYGAKGSRGSIPGDATLKFEVECIDFSTPSSPQADSTRNIFQEIDKDDDWLITYDELMEFHINKFGSKKPPPPGFWERFDKNEDGIIDWYEFTGPKGTEEPPPKINKKAKKEL